MSSDSSCPECRTRPRRRGGSRLAAWSEGPAARGGVRAAGREDQQGAASSPRTAAHEVVGLDLDSAGRATPWRRLGGERREGPRGRGRAPRGASAPRAHAAATSPPSPHRSWSCGTEARSIFVYGWSGFAEHRGRRPHLHDPAAAEDHRPLADVVAERQVVGDEQDPQAARLQVAEQVQDVDPRRRVEHADDLVGHEVARCRASAPGRSAGAGPGRR